MEVVFGTDLLNSIVTAVVSLGSWSCLLSWGKSWSGLGIALLRKCLLTNQKPLVPISSQSTKQPQNTMGSRLKKVMLSVMTENTGT